MLRITRSTEDGTTRIKLEGRLVGPWVDECRASCTRRPGEALTVDVSEVRFVDAQGMELLRELAGSGLVSRSSGYTKELMRRGDSMAIEHHQRKRSVPSEAASARALVDRLRAGTEEAREELARSHGGAMLATARRYFPHGPEAGEALRDAFQVAFRAAGECACDSELERWLHRIVVDACVTRLRPAVRHAPPLDGLLPAFDDGGRHAAPVAPWPVPDLASPATRETVRRCVASLPAPHRVVLLLCDFEGLDTREAAERLELPHFAVATRLHRARQALLTLLASTLSPREVG
jgi:RNA polymerase sigma-70 factor (ECF subfamily)